MEAVLLSSPEVGDTMVCRTEEDVECQMFYFVGDDVRNIQFVLLFFFYIGRLVANLYEFVL